MRRAWTIGAILAALVLLAAGNAQAGASSGVCAQALPPAPVGLPAPVAVTTRCGRFRLEPSGNVVFERARTSPVPRVAQGYSPQDLTWYGFARGHLLIGRGLRQLWRSHDRYPGTYPGNVDAVVLGPGELAFSYYVSFRKPPRLYFARYRGRERVVARGETPLTFLASRKLIAWRERGRALVLRASSGRLERLIATNVAALQVDRRSGLLLFRTGDDLLLFDGDAVRELASLRSLGLNRRTTLVELLGRHVAAHDGNRLVVLDYEGHVVSSTALPGRIESADRVSSPIVANAAGTAVAYTATLGNTAYGSQGRETVYVLSAGEQRARPVFSEDLEFKLCERMASLAWRGSWLLYSNSEQRAAVVDSSAEAAPVELSGVIARLPGAQGEGFFDIDWSGVS